MAGFDDFPAVSGFDDFPAVSGPQPAAANPFNRVMGADQSFGAPLGPAPIPAGQEDLGGEARAALGGPITDRMASAFQTYAPSILGGNDRAYAGNLAENRAATEQAQQAHPADAMAGNIGAAVPYAMLAPEGVLGATVAGTIAGGANSPDWSNWQQTAKDAAIGGAAGGVLGKGGEWLGGQLGKLAPAAVDASVPTFETIGAMKNQAYKAADELGVSYSPEAFSGLVGKITDDARAANLDPDIHRGAASVIGNLQRTAENGEPITLTQLDQKRQLVSRDASGTPADQFFGNQIRSNIDNFIANAGPDAMASGSGPEAAAAIQNARRLNTIYAKSEALNDQLEHARDLAGTSGSGANLDNKMRAAMRMTQDARGGWTPDEAALLQTGIRGGTGQNLLRKVGRLAPTGIPLGMEALSAGGGYLAHGGAGAAVPLAIGGIGAASRGAADYMTNANARNLMATILAGGTKAPSAPPVNLSPLAAGLAGYAPNVRR